MDDSQIIDLFFARSELAISELDAKYGKVCHKLAHNILDSRQDAEECVNDAYLGTWNAIPPQRPDPLLPFVCVLVRRYSIMRYRANTAMKRNSSYDACMEEIENCIAAPGRVEDHYEAKVLARTIERFLDTLNRENRVIFMRRYWYSDSYAAIAALTGLTEKNVSVRLARVRKQLRDYLMKQGGADMNRELFSDAMNEIDSKYVEEALTYKPAKRFVFPVWAQRCVAACLICVLGLGVVLAASPEARAEIQRWIETWRGSQVSYTYFGDPLEKPIPHYQITALPEGFAEELDQRFDETDCVQHSYRRGDERIILGYIYMQDDNFSFYDMGEDTEISELEVNGNPGKFYLSDDPALWSVIEWIDTEHSIHFSINACGTQKELLALAESVKPAEDDICTAGENTEPPVELGEGEIWREEPWTDIVSG